VHTLRQLCQDSPERKKKKKKKSFKLSHDSFAPSVPFLQAKMQQEQKTIENKVELIITTFPT
jgi:hypothetical protein